jgi:hypothetical protein
LPETALRAPANQGAEESEEPQPFSDLVKSYNLHFPFIKLLYPLIRKFHFAGTKIPVAALEVVNLIIGGLTKRNKSQSSN